MRLRRRAFRRADRAMVALARAGLALLAGMIVRPDSLGRSPSKNAVARLDRQRRRMMRLWDRARAELDTAIWQAHCHAVKARMLRDPVARAQVLADLGGEGALRRWEGRWKSRWEARREGSRAMALAELGRIGIAPTRPADVRLRHVHPDVAQRILSARTWPLAPGPTRRRDLTGRFALAPIGHAIRVSGQRPHAWVRLEVAPGHGLTREDIVARLRGLRQAEREAHHARLISADPSTRRAARLDPCAHSPIWLTADELREGLSAAPLPVPTVSRSNHQEREINPDIYRYQPVERPHSVRVRASPGLAV